jgi:hypothetical protein
MRVAPTVVLAAVLALPACGRKSRVVPPQVVQPETVGSLAAESTPQGVLVSWLRPTRYTGGRTMNDLARFVIERAGVDGHFQPIGQLQLDDRTRFRKERRMEWTDTEVVAGARYTYRITAITLDRYRSAPAQVDIVYEPKEPAR